MTHVLLLQWKLEWKKLCALTERRRVMSIWTQMMSFNGNWSEKLLALTGRRSVMFIWMQMMLLAWNLE